jgi:hypothetical protein
VQAFQYAFAKFQAAAGHFGNRSAVDDFVHQQQMFVFDP